MFKTKKAPRHSKDDDYDDDEEEIPVETGRVYDTSEKDGRYGPIRTDPENDSLQIHTEGERLQVENLKHNVRQSNQSIKKPFRYGSVPY